MKNLALTMLWASLILPIQSQTRQGGGIGSPAPKITPTTEAQLVAMARHDWALHRPLPFLPDLDRPVHVKVGHMVCSEAEDLINPDTAIVLYLRLCVVSQNGIRVKVILPETEQGYILAYTKGVIRVAVPWVHKKEELDTIHTAWVSVLALSN